MKQEYTPAERQLVANTDHVRAVELERALLYEPPWWGIDLGFEPGVFSVHTIAKYAKHDAFRTEILGMLFCSERAIE